MWTVSVFNPGGWRRWAVKYGSQGEARAAVISLYGKPGRVEATDQGEVFVYEGFTVWLDS